MMSSTGPHPLVSLAGLAKSSLSLSKRRKLLLVVVHLVDPSGDDQRHADMVSLAIAQSRVALSNGADGLFLIPAMAGLATDVVRDVYERVRGDVGADVFIGVNLMSNEAAAKDGPPPGANGLWTDTGVDLEGVSDQARAISEQAIGNAGDEGAVPWLWFVGFLFKGKARTFIEGSTSAEREQATGAALEQLRGLGPPPGRVVLCTSGPGTGSPLELERAKLYRKLAGEDAVIAVASGVTVENVDEILPFVDVFMVATGVEAEPDDPQVIAFYKEAGIPCAKVGYLDPHRVAALSQKIHQGDRDEEEKEGEGGRSGGGDGGGGGGGDGGDDGDDGGDAGKK